MLLALSNGPFHLIFESLTITGVVNLSRTSKRMKKIVENRAYPMLFDAKRTLDMGFKIIDYHLSIKNNFICSCCGFLTEFPYVCKSIYKRQPSIVKHHKGDCNGRQQCQYCNDLIYDGNYYNNNWKDTKQSCDCVPYYSSKGVHKETDQILCQFCVRHHHAKPAYNDNAGYYRKNTFSTHKQYTKTFNKMRAHDLRVNGGQTY